MVVKLMVLTSTVSVNRNTITLLLRSRVKLTIAGEVVSGVNTLTGIAESLRISVFLFPFISSIAFIPKLIYVSLSPVARVNLSFIRFLSYLEIVTSIIEEFSIWTVPEVKV